MVVDAAPTRDGAREAITQILQAGGVLEPGVHSATDVGGVARRMKDYTPYSWLIKAEVSGKD